MSFKVAIPPAALYLAWAWGSYLQHRFGNVVSPDQTIPAGFATVVGWFLIFVAACVALVVA